MIEPGEIISYLDMCREEGVNLQRGMNFRLNEKLSVILMSLRPGSPYADRIKDEGKVLIYEGHDAPKKKGEPSPKTIDQPFRNPGGSLTQNGLFFEAANRYHKSRSDPEIVKVYEKIRSGIWAYNGLFRLVEAWQETCNARKVFKFRLKITGEDHESLIENRKTLEHNRLIPASVKISVWKRDRGKCVKCGSPENLHFDHIIPYSKGGSSLVAENIQLLCARHNLAKRDRIE